MAGETVSVWYLALAAPAIAAFGAWVGNAINGAFAVRSQTAIAQANAQAAAPKNATDAQKTLVEGLTGFINELQEERRDLLSEIRQLRDRFDTQSAKIERLQNEVAGLTSHVGNLSTHIGRLELLMTENGLTPPSRPTWERG